MSNTGHWAIAIHGGAGTITRQTSPHPYEQALKVAVDEAYAVIEAGGNTDNAIPWDDAEATFPSTAVAAALAAVESLESCVLFNAGKRAASPSHGST